MDLVRRLRNTVWRLFGSLGILIEKVKEPELAQATFKLFQPVAHHKELVRVGPNGDGGYLLPNDLGGLGAVLSPGVADTAGFEEFFAKRGVDCFLIDPSVDRAPVAHEKIFFEKLALGAETSSAGVQSVSLNDWVASIETDRDLLLQMDIEGSEWEVLLSSDYQTLKRFRFMVIEFHNLPMIFNKAGRIVVQSVMKKILQSHVPVHAHPNNCCGIFTSRRVSVPLMLEVTFARKWPGLDPQNYAEVPHLKDVDNVSRKPISLHW